MAIIKFRYPHNNNLHTVSLIGEWSNWKEIKLKRKGKYWEKEIDIPNGEYLYKFKINNKTDKLDKFNHRVFKDGQQNPASYLISGTYSNKNKTPEEYAYHQEDSRFIEIFKKSLIRIRVRILNKNITNVYLTGNGFSIEMKEIYSSSLYRVFEFYGKLIDDKFKYYFELKEINKSSLYYCSNNLIKQKPVKKDWFSFNKKYYQLTYPEWVNKSIFYQIFPDRFNNIKNKNNLLSKWGNKPENNNFFGGNLKGIQKKLAYIQSLGITAIYLNPIFTAGSNHRYDTYDYFSIDPMLGTKKDLVELVKDAHKRGIKVILDGVFNHTGLGFFAFEDILKNNKKSNYINWFKINKLPLNPHVEDCGYESWAGFRQLPTLNINNIDVQKYIFKAARYWIKEADIDGWRLDVPFEIPHWFWKKFRKEIIKEKKDAYILGEIWEDGTEYFKGDEFDGVMNYRLRSALINFINDEKSGSQNLADEINRLYAVYPSRAFYLSMNLLSSHDVARLFTVLYNSEWKYKILYLMLFTLPGTVSLYYGDEIGMPGKMDPDCRRCMKWSGLNKREKRIKEFIKNLIHLRKTERALTEGNIDIISSQNGLFIFTRQIPKERIIVLVNTSSHGTKVVLNLNNGITDIINKKKYKQGKHTINIPSQSFTVLKDKIKKSNNSHNKN